jgi:hypothetical protein
MHNFGSRTFALVTVVVMFTLLGCSASPGPQEETGTLSASLVAAGSDGASYRFPSGTSMLFCPAAGGVCGTVQLDGPESQVSATLPTGAYQVLRFNPTNPPNQLLRTLGGVTTTVSAALLNSQPITFSILKDQTTVLALHFQVNSVGDVTFDAGKLVVTVDVTQNDVGTGSFVIGRGTLNVSSVAFDPSANQEARQLLAASPGDMVPYSITYQTTGSWMLQPDGTTTVTIRASSVTFPPSAPGIGTRLTQVLKGDGVIQITDNGATDGVFINARLVDGTSDHPTALPDKYLFGFILSGSIADVFDGVHLTQTALETRQPVSGVSFEMGTFDETLGLFTSRVNGSISNETLQLIP